MILILKNLVWGSLLIKEELMLVLQEPGTFYLSLEVLIRLKWITLGISSCKIIEVLTKLRVRGSSDC